MKKYRQIIIRHLFLLALAVNLLTASFAQTAQSNSTIDAAVRQEVIEGAIKALNDAYVFPETAKKMEQAIRDRVQRKEYDDITDGRTLAVRLTTHLQEISHDKHLRVLFNDGSSPFFTQQTADFATRREISVKRNFSFEKVERLSGNVGYLDLRGFESPHLASETATAAMNFLANTDALIIDLRQNGGGDPAMVAFLCSYLFDQRTHLNDIYSRPDNKTEEFWTKDVPGKKYGDKPVFVLTSGRTFSGAEEFSYNLKNLKRATIIGETTGGGAHPVNPRRLGKDFLVMVPFARSINPITKTNWEGTGVKPDVDVPAAQALKVAHLLAIRAIQPKITQPLFADPLKTLAAGLQRELDEAKITLPASLNISAAASSASSSPTPAQSHEPVTASQAPASAFEMPGTPAGKALDKFLKSLNSGDLATMKKFHQETGGDVENAEQDFGFYQQSGGLTPHSVVRSAEFEIEILAQAKKDGRWLKFGIAVEPRPPHGVTELRVNEASAPSGEKKVERSATASGPAKAEGESASRNAPKTEAEVLQELPVWIDKEAAADNFSGVVLIAKGDKPIFQKAVGLADKVNKTPNRINTKFNLGSINKIFTQIAIMQLIEQGKLSWEDKLGKYLPDYPNQDAREKVTIRQLVEMQSGIGDFFGPKFDATPKERIRTINDYLPLFTGKPLAFEPGSSRAYSNGGYVVLGAIIEKITGQTYYDYVREHIYKPAGMTDTDSFISGAGTPNMAEGYRRNEKGERVNNFDTRPGRGSSAGGGYSTAEDLLKFANALREYKLLSPQGSRRILGRAAVAGGAPGINAEMEIGPVYTIIVLGNYDPPNAANVSRYIRKQLMPNEQ